jgi:hypothetical protein
MLNDGRVFFTSAAPLVPQDTNGQADVYEWEEGEPHLISRGSSAANPSVFNDASADGSDVFFTTSQSLVPLDQDEIIDLYDARENGGFLPQPGPSCSPEAQCPATSGTPPALGGTPVSATFTGTEGASPTPKGPPVKPKPLTRAQKLTKALTACHAKRDRGKRNTCEVSARKRYGPIHHASSKRRKK